MREHTIRAVSLAVITSLLALPLAAQEPLENKTDTISFDVSISQELRDDSRSDDLTGALNVSPHLVYRMFFPRGYVNFDYRGSMRQEAGAQDRVNHGVAVDGMWQVSRNLVLQFQQRGTYSSNPFDRTVAAPEPTIRTMSSVEPGHNHSFAGDDQRFVDLEAMVGMNWRATRRTSWSWSANYYRQDNSSARLFDIEDRSVSVGFNWDYGKGKRLAVEQSAQDFRASIAEYRVRALSTFLVHSWQVNPRTKLNVYAGPQISRITAHPTVTIDFDFFDLELGFDVSEKVFGYAWGADLGHQLTSTTGFNVGASRRVADGGGFTGTSVETSYYTGLRHQFNRRWSGHVAVRASDRRALAGIGSSDHIAMWSGNGGVEYRVNPHWSLSASYDYRMMGNGSQQVRELFSGSRAMFSVRYHLGTIPIGR